MPIFTMKDTWYWSIVKIPLKVYGQPAVIHELGSNLNGDKDLPKALCCWRTTIEDWDYWQQGKTPLNPWIQIPLCVIVLLSLFSLLLSHLYVLLRKLFYLVKSRMRTIYSDTKGSSIPGGSWYGRRYLGAGSAMARRTSASIVSPSSFCSCSCSSLAKSLINSKDPKEPDITSSLLSVKSMIRLGCGVGLLSAKLIGSSI